MPCVNYYNTKRRVYAKDEEPTPLVIVEGFLGGSLGAQLWGKYEEHLNRGCGDEADGKHLEGKIRRRRSIFVSLGPVSSFHDRACELYYALVGGQVDYGAQHAEQHNHSRFGRSHSQGLYPQWSIGQPLHFLGHSIGAPTIVKLQHLMQTGHFGSQAHPDMILSLTSICAPFRGTPLVYTLGECVDAAPAVRTLSIGSMLTKGIHILSYFSPILPAYLDMHSESRSLSFDRASFRSLLKQLWRSDWAGSKDSAPFDVTFSASDMRELNGEGHPNPQTYYSSYVGSLAQRSGPPSKSLLRYLLHIPFRVSSFLISSFDLSSLRPIPTFLDTLTSDDLFDQRVYDHVQGVGDRRQLALRDNDGVVPTFSQWHPFPCRYTKCRHIHPQVTEPSSSPTPGIWQVRLMEGSHHLSLVPVWMATDEQRTFWEFYGNWLRNIDARHKVCRTVTLG